MTVIDARSRFAAKRFEAQRQAAATNARCRECGQPGTTVVFPYVDHRRRKPWPQPYWLCTHHKDNDI